MGFRTPLARARGLGSARAGVEHWWAERLTAAVLVPLTFWLVIALVGHAGGGYEAAVAWLSSPVTAVVLGLYLAIGFYHSQLGLQVIVEDYVHARLLRMATLVVLQSLHVALAVASIFALLWLALGNAS